MAKLREDQHNWFAVEVFTGKEISIDFQLKRRALTTFLPTHKLRRLRSRGPSSHYPTRSVIVEEALFPGYLFANIFPFETQSIIRCPGVMGIVSLRGDHVVIDREIIEELRARTDQDGCLITGLKVGDQARITEGQYAGQQGRINRLSTEQLVAEVWLEINGNTWRVEAATNELQAVTA